MSRIIKIIIVNGIKYAYVKVDSIGPLPCNNCCFSYLDDNCVDVSCTNKSYYTNATKFILTEICNED